MNETSMTLKNIPLRYQIKALLIEWIGTSTSHGLPSVFRVEKTYLKVIWFTCFVVSTLLCSYIIIQSVIAYTEYEVTVSTTMVNDLPLFPAVTICNVNPFFKNRSFAFIRGVVNKTRTRFAWNLTELNRSTNALVLARAINEYLKVDSAVLVAQSDRPALGFYLDDMLISCIYDGAECTSSDFTFIRSFDYGNCYTYNSGFTSNGSNASLKTIFTIGPESGLSIELFSGDPDEEMFVYKRGFYVFIHNQSVTPIMDNEGIHVSTGMQTNIGIKRSFYFKKPKPYSECIEDTTSVDSSPSYLYKSILGTLHQKSYRQRYCFKLCYQQSVIDTCGCYDPRYPNHNISANSCFKTKERACLENIRGSFDSRSANCMDYCPEECTSLMYTTSVSLAAYPTDFYLKWLLLQETLTEKISDKKNLAIQIQKSVAKINIFYDEYFYTAYSETATMTWDGLLGDIGGQLGLFIGISLLSLVEILEISLEILRVIYYHLKYSNNEMSLALNDIFSNKI